MLLDLLLQQLHQHYSSETVQAHIATHSDEYCYYIS